MPNLKLSIVAAVLGDDAREAARLARIHGFDGLQFDAFSAALRLTDLSQTGRREFVHVLASEGRQLVGLRADVGPRGLGPGSDADRILHGLNQVLETAAGLGAPLVCVELGPLPAAPVVAKPKPAIPTGLAGLILLPAPSAEPAEAVPAESPADPAFISQVDGALAELGRAADRYGTVVALRSSLAGLAALERALKAVSCPWFGIDLDRVALLCDPWDVDEAFSRLGASIRHVRGRDATRGADRRTTPAAIGQGSTEWAHLLANLDAAACNAWITLDSLEQTARLPAAVAGAEYLRQLSQRA
jgi:sugar phosphate isomerase/epimerase